MKILITNDDGIKAAGIKALYEVAKDFGDIVIVAPSEQKSAASQSIIIGRDMTFYKTNLFDCESYAVDGNPVDCVKLAIRHIYKNNRPDLVLSGINWGANLGVSVLYSGTVASALEGSIQNIRSIAYSLDSHGKEDYYFSQEVVKKTLKDKLYESIPKRVTLNVNIPNIQQKQCSGYKFTSQADSTWNEVYTVKPETNGKQSVYLDGELIDFEKKENDIKVFEKNYVSITPLKTQYTDFESLDKLKYLHKMDCD